MWLPPPWIDPLLIPVEHICEVFPWTCPGAVVLPPSPGCSIVTMQILIELHLLGTFTLSTLQPPHGEIIKLKFWSTSSQLFYFKLSRSDWVFCREERHKLSQHGNTNWFHGRPMIQLICLTVFEARLVTSQNVSERDCSTLLLILSRCRHCDYCNLFLMMTANTTPTLQHCRTRHVCSGGSSLKSF